MDVKEKTWAHWIEIFVPSAFGEQAVKDELISGHKQPLLSMGFDIVVVFVVAAPVDQVALEWSVRCALSSPSR